MDTTTPSAISQTTSTALDVSAITNNLDFWIKLVSVFSTAFAVFIAAIAIIFAILTWSHFKQKEKAENEIKEIIRIREEMNLIFGGIKKHFDLIQQLANNASEDYKAINAIREKVKTSKEDINRKYETLGKTLTSLATITSVNPGDVITPAKKDFGSTLYEAARRYLENEKIDKK